MAANYEDIKWLYDKLKSQGYNIGNENEFTASLANESDRQWYYEKAKGMGLNFSNIDDFNSLYAPAAPQSNSAMGRVTRKVTDIYEQARKDMPAVEGGSPIPTTAAAPTPQVKETASAAPATAKPEVEEKAPEAPKGWQPTMQQRLATAQTLNGGMTSFRASAAAGRERTHRAMERNTSQGRRQTQAAQMQARMAGLPTQALGIGAAAPKGETGSDAPSTEPRGVTGKAAEVSRRAMEKAADREVRSLSGPVVRGMVPGPDGKPVTQWELPDGTLTTDFAEADRAAASSRRNRLAHEFTQRMEQNGLNPGKREDVEVQAAVEAIKTGNGMDAGKRADIVAALRDNGLDPENEEHIMWAVTGDERKMLEYRLHKTESELKELNHKRAEMRQWGSQVGYGGFVSGAGQIPTPHPTVTGATQSAIDKEIENATAEVVMLRNAIRDFDNNKSASGKNWFGKIMQGLWDGVSDPNTWTSGILDLSVNSTARNANPLTGSGRSLLESWQMSQEMMAKSPNPGGFYNGGHFAGEMLADPVTYISAVAGMGATKMASGAMVKATGKRMSKEVAERFAANRLGNRLVSAGVGTGANLFTFEGLRDMRQQAIDGGWTDSNGQFHEGFSWGHALKEGGSGFLLGTTMGVFGAGIGNVGNWAVKNVSKSSLAGKAAIRGAQHGVSFVGEGTIFAIPEIINFHTMDDKTFDELYAEKFGYDSITDASERKQERDKARNSLSWDAWSESQAMIFGMKVAGKATHPKKMITDVSTRLTSLRRQGARDHVTFSEKVKRMLDQSPFDMSFTSDEREELREGGYGELADLFRKGNHVAENPAFDGYEAMEHLMKDRSVSQAARAKAYFILTGRMLPPATVTGYTTFKEPDGRITVKALTEDGEVVTSRNFRTEKESRQEVENIRRQAELNSIEVGERRAEDVAADMILDAALKEVAPDADPIAIADIYRAVKEGEKDVTESQIQLAEQIDDAIVRNKHVADKYLPDAIREALKEETGIDVDAALRKASGKRTEAERKVIEDYLAALYPDGIGEDAPHSNRGTMGNGEVTAVDSAEKDVNLQGERNSDGEDYGNRPQQNNDGPGYSSGLDGGSMAGDAARSVAADRDRGDIRMYEEGLGSSQNEYSEYSERDRREAESERLVGIARANGQYITRDELKSRGKLYPKGTGESEVVIDAEGGRVYKIKNPYAKSPMKGNVEPEDAIFEHLVHNRYFPETAYRFEGISDDAGDVRIVLSQDYIESVGQPTQKEIDAALAEKGLKPEGKYTYGNEEVSVTDVTGDNALKGADGKVYFIDPVINIKKPVREILGEAPYPQATKGERAIQEAEQAGYNMTGLEERQQVMRNFRYWESRMEELFGLRNFEEMLETELGTPQQGKMLDALEESEYNATERAVIAGYIKSRWSSDAIFRRIRDDRGAAMEQQYALLEKESHEDGYIRPATLKGESSGEYIYIIKGDVVPTEDGSMINTAVSDDVIYIYDPKTDKVKQTSSSKLASLGTTTSVEEARSEIEHINKTNYDAEVDALYGRTGTFSPGDTFVADVWGEGPQENRVVGTDENGMIIFETEGKTGQYGLMPDQVSSLVDRYEQEAFNAEMRRQEEIMASVEETPSDRLGEATAEPAPSASISIKYDQGDSFRVSVSGREETQQAAVVDRKGETVTIWTPFPVNDKSEKGRTMAGYTTDITRADLDAIVVRDEQGKPLDYVAANPEAEPEAAPAEASAGPDETVEIPHSIRNAMEEETPAIDERYTQPITEAETPTPDVEPMPMRTMKEKGETWEEPDYLATTPQRSHAYIYNEAGLSRQEANDHVAHMARTAKEAVDKHKKSAPKIGGSIARFQKEKAEWEKKGAELQRAVDFWDAVKAEQKRVTDAERAALKEQQEQAHDEAVASFEEEQRIKAAKQAEQDAIGTNAVNSKLKAKWDAAPKIVGNANAHVLADGSTITGHYILTEAGAASASHDPNNAFAPTEGFPIDENVQNVNDRDYSRDKDAQRMVENMGAAFDSRALQTPVIVSRDGIVLSGNNRTMSGDLASAQGTDKAYVDHLRQYGNMYGFTPEQVASMKHPRVVFVPDEALPYDSATFSRFNAQEMKSQSKPEAAVKLGKIVPDAVFNNIVGDINRYERMSDFYANETAAASALGALHAAGVVNDAQMPELRTGTALSAAGKELLENTLIGKVFQSDPDAVRKIMEIPSMRQTIVMALAEVANNRALASKGYDIVEELSKAVDLCYSAKSAHPDVFVHGAPVSPFGRQQGLFDDEFGESRVTDATTLLLADLLNDTRPSRLRNVLTIYNKEAGNSAAGSMDLFTGEIPSKEAILTEINNHFINATPKEQQAIVDAAIAERRAAAEEAAAVAATEGSGEGGQRPEQAPDFVQRSERNQGNSLGETRDRSIDDFFGPVYTEFQGKGSEAEAYLREMCEGVAKGALTYPGITPIDLAWGDNKAGYMKIVIKHPEVVGRLQELLDQCKITNQSENRIILQSDTHKFIVSKMKGSTPTDNWLLTAYHKKEKSVSASSSDIETEPGGKRNGTATPQNGLSSDGKVNNSTLEKQEEGAKSSEAEALGVKNLPAKERLASMTYDEVEQIYADYDAAIDERYDAMIEPLESEKAILENKRRTPAEGKRLKAIDKEIADIERQQEEERLKVGKYFSEELRRRWKTGEHTLTPEEDAQNLFMDEADTKKAETAAKIAAAESEVNTEPTEAQKKAGNYKMGHVEIDGLQISIENPKGSMRRGKEPDGTPWETEMKNTYGYIKGTTGVDGDKIDVFLSDNPTDGDVYVVDQYNPDGTFDEHKVMYGFTSATEAEAAYLSNYSADWAKDRKVVVSGVTREEFKKWLDASDRKKKPFADYTTVKKKVSASSHSSVAEYKSVKPIEAQSDVTNTQPEEERELLHAETPHSNRSAMEGKLSHRVYEAAKGMLEAAGIPVVEVNGQEAQAMLEQKNTPFAGLPNRANEKQPSGSVLAAHNGDSSSNATDSRKAEAKIDNNTRSAKTKIKKFKNGDFDGDYSTLYKALSTMGSLLSMRNRGGSRYTILRTDKGDTVAIRLSDHRANGNNFGRDVSDRNLSIVIERKRYDVPDSEIEFTEAVIPQRVFETQPKEVVSAIVNGVDDVLADKPFTLDGSLGSVIEHHGNDVRFHIRTYHGTGAEFDRFDFRHIGSGEGAQVYGWGGYVTEVKGIGKGYATAIGGKELLPKIEKISGNIRQVRQWLSKNGDYSKYARSAGKHLRELQREYRAAEKAGDEKDMEFYRGLIELQEQSLVPENHASLISDKYGQIAEYQKELDGLNAELVQKRHLYTVRIPDDTGGNYLDWDGKIPEDIRNRIVLQATLEGVSLDFYGDSVTAAEYFSKMGENATGFQLYRTLTRALGSDRMASELLSRAGLTGIKYAADHNNGGRADGKKNYVLFNDADMKITNHVQFMNDRNGNVYGWTVGGKVYLNRDAMNPETPLHEYTHLWDEMVRKENPQLWTRGKELLRETPLWDEVMNDPNYQNIRDDEDAVASEVHSRLTGKDGARILADMIEGAKKKGVIETAQAVTLVERLKGWLADMFKSLKKTLGKWSKRDLDNLTVDDFNRMTLRDLAEGVNPDVELRDGETDRFHAAMSHRREDFAEVRERAVAERGIVMPGLKDKTVRVVEVTRHDFKGSGKEALKAAEKWAKENIVGVHQATDSRGDTFDYSISKDAVEKYVSRSATDKSENIGVHLAALKKLPEIIGNSIEAEVHADYHKDSRQVRTSEAGYNPDNLIHRFYGAANIDGAIYRVKTTIIESGIGQKNKPHSYEVTTMELTEEPAGQGWHERAGTASTLSRYSGSSSETGMAVHTFTLPVAKLLKGAEKSYDSGKKLLDESARDLKYRTPEEGIEYVNGRAIQPWSERLDYLRRKRDERGYSLSSSEREEVRALGAQEKAWEEKWAAEHTDTDVPTGRRSRFEYYADQYGQGGMTAELNQAEREAGPLRDSEGRLISANARDLARRAIPILMRRRADLLADRPSFSRAGQAAIDAELADLEYMALYYQRMEAGEDVERTMPGRLEHQRMLATANEVAASLGEKVVLYEAPGDIHDSNYNRQVRKQRSYGWYNPNDGTIHINVGRHRSAQEIVKTVLHEIVGHKTIEQIMGPKRFARLIDEIWNHAGKKVRAKIAEKMHRNGWDYREATKEYLGELAEEVHTKGYETLEAEKKTIWQRVKAKIQDFLNRILEGLKIPARIRLTENDLSYMMWKLYKHKERKAAGKPAEGDIFDKAEEIVRREEWERDGNSLEIAARSEEALPKRERIKKLRNSEPVEITGNEIESSSDIKQYKKNALEYGKSLQGEYVNEDTGNLIQLQRGRRNGGINEILQHDYKDDEHIQSIAALPQIIERGIYIDSYPNRDNEKNPEVESYQHYVCGLRIGGEDYTVHSVVAVDINGRRYYDHKLSHIEKGKLLDFIEAKQSAEQILAPLPSTQSKDTAPLTIRSERKINELISLLQVDDEKDAEMRYTSPEPEYRPRQKPAPRNTIKVYKLVRIKEDHPGEWFPLFIDSAAPLRLGEWLDADSPDLEMLRGREPGQYLVNPQTKEVMTREEVYQQHPELRSMSRGHDTKYPSVDAINYATDNGLRWMEIEETDKAQRRFDGENRRYWNLGINGSGSVSTFSMRPGWHAGSLPTMRQIGKGKNKNLRDDNFVWVEGEVSADVDYQAEAERNPDKDLPDRIPEDGFYMKATNANKTTSQADRVGWYVAGSFKANRFISDAEARQIIDDFNAAHPDMDPVAYDYDRESGRTYDPEAGLHFRDGDDIQDMTIEEQTLKLAVMLADRHSGDVAVRDAAVEALGKTLGNIRKAMAVQHTYDFNTVRSLGAVADILISSGTFLPEGPGEVKRLYGIMKRGIGHAYTDDSGVEHVAQSEKDYNAAVESLMDLFVSNQLKLSGKFLDEVMKIRGSKVNARGVEVMGNLDVEGQIMVRGMKDYMNMDVQTIHDRIDALDDIIANGNDAASMNAAAEKMGLELAEQYVAEVSDRVAQEKVMRDQLRDMTSQWDASMSGDVRKAYTEQKRALRESIRKIRIERADAMRQLASQVGNELRNSIERVKAFREREKQRIEEIWHNANSDMQGRPHYEHGMEKKGLGVKLSNNMVSRLLLAPAATFEQVMRVFGSKSVDGEGYLFDRYVRGWQECRDREWTSTQEAEGILNSKAAEILGKRKARWSDLYSLTRKKAGSCSWLDGGEMREHKVTQGNLMYMYMVNKMTDGQVKLRRMCITDDKMQEIEQALDPKLKAVADWLQEELLPNLRNKYNEVHVRMFGAPMAEIENYFPLKILANARLEEVEMAGKIDGKDLPKTMTGAIIKRRFNNYALDVLNSDAVSVALDHIREMETWAAFAEYRRDLCTLLSYKHFRNQVKNMSTIYGSGEKFWDKFYDLALLVGGAYQPKTSEFDKAAVNITKLATGACIAIRLNTALKQLLSYPAFAPDANKFRLIYNVTPWRARACWKWAMKNMPSFQRRWKSRQAGNDILRAWKHDWDWTRTDLVQKVQRAGITPNAFIDALTVAMGSEAVYHSKFKDYLKDGFSKEEAHRRAIQDAEIIFNLSQQSSELPYLSLLQNDRSYLTTCITNFRNSPMSYLRQSIQSKRELVNMVKSKDIQIEFETKKGVREGLTPEQAKARAERKYKRNWSRNLFKSTTFDYILPALWAFGLTGMWYCIFGDDEEKKKELAEDAMKRGLLGGLEGFTFGGTMPDFIYGLATGDKPQLDEETSPAMGLITDMANLYSNGKTERAANEMINTMIALGVGFNPQVLEDGVVAGMDFFGHDEKNARDWALLFMRVLSCPQSQMDQVYFDELGMDAREAQRMSPAELADRYATYKARRANFATMWAYDDDRWETEIKGTWRKRFEKEAKERLKGQSEDHVNASLERYESEFSETKKRLEALADSSDIIGNAAKAQAIWESPEGKRYDLQKDEHVKSTLDNMIKSWLNAPTPEKAATEATAILEYKAGVVEMLDAWDDPQKSRGAKERVKKIADDWHERHAPKKRVSR